jgi:hypothetical protein
MAALCRGVIDGEDLPQYSREMLQQPGHQQFAIPLPRGF